MDPLSSGTVSRVKLADLQGRHAGETVYVLGSGPSLGFVDPKFFLDKTVVSTNFSASTLGISDYYLFTHYHYVVEDLREEFRAAVTHRLCSTRWSGEIFPGRGENKSLESLGRNVIVNDPPVPDPPGSSFDPWTMGERDRLVFGSSSVHGAIQLAAEMGARWIVLLGADCGTIDAKDRITGYPVAGHAPWALYNRDLVEMKRWIRHVYGSDVYSLNPFVNFNLEGHKFQGVNRDT